MSGHTYHMRVMHILRVNTCMHGPHTCPQLWHLVYGEAATVKSLRLAQLGHIYCQFIRWLQPSLDTICCGELAVVGAAT